ncbi:hypothetical protein [Caldimonas brevitalea]|uniref:Membrane protein n=1 Tax=Caldimonas brevitalea TaxID=413882 RepID=A0A0G3BWH4_9BURK|nr:hypothetical protein [Caldimonas brevitalea]AKJ30865.1 membrane protein [Caldimonas brevitalea]
MANDWPWLAVAGLGALHGLNPATGWLFAAASHLQAGEGAPLWRVLGPIALGHLAAVALVPAAVALGVSLHGTAARALVFALLAVIALCQLSGCALRRAPGAVRHAGLALWSFTISAVHGAGFMLVPALTSLCLSNAPARQLTASGSLLLALTAVVVHTTAMLVVSALMASVVCRAAQGVRERLRRPA